MKKPLILTLSLVLIMLFLLSGVRVYGKDDKMIPKEPGVYIKYGKELKRLLPNIVFEQEQVIYIESNNPPRFLLKDIDYFVIAGQYDLSVLTLNPLLFFQPSPLGKHRYIFGKDIPFDMKKIKDNVYSIKPKGLIGRGYFSLWINDAAWDFIVE